MSTSNNCLWLGDQGGFIVDAQFSGLWGQVDGVLFNEIVTEKGYYLCNKIVEPMLNTLSLRYLWNFDKYPLKILSWVSTPKCLIHSARHCSGTGKQWGENEYFAFSVTGDTDKNY